jgi:hypothetical protein
MPRVRSQLAIQADPELLQRLRTHAEATGRTVTSLVLEGIEAVLNGRLGASGHGKADPSLLARIEAVEHRLQQLEAARTATVRSTPPAPPPRSPEVAITPITGETIGVPELAALLGVSTKAVSKWAKDHGAGAVRDGWRLLGKVPAPGPGVPRWRFERVST